MSSEKKSPKIIILSGPTASGKTAALWEIARRFPVEAVNADSRQFYRGMDIGTAKATAEQRRQVKHHLIDVADPSEAWDAGKFVLAADVAIEKIFSEKKIPVIVGGTGMYLARLVFGIRDLPPIPEEIRSHLKERLLNEGLPVLYAELGKRDELAAKKLHPHDTQRILRALEVVLATGKSQYESLEPPEPRYQSLNFVLDVPPEVLAARIERRVDAMFAQGLKNEALSLWEKFPESPVLAKTIGYAEWREHGNESEKFIREKIIVHTRQYAKRQRTWFRHQMNAMWINFEKSLAEIFIGIENFFGSLS